MNKINNINLKNEIINKIYISININNSFRDKQSYMRCNSILKKKMIWFNRIKILDFIIVENWPWYCLKRKEEKNRVI